MANRCVRVVRSDNIVVVASIDEGKEKNGPLELVSYESLEEDLAKESEEADFSQPEKWKFD